MVTRDSNGRFVTSALEESFWSRVQKKSYCWIWTGGRDKDGYGRFCHAKKQRRAHRTSYELMIGVIPSGMLVCHTCDNPPCVNPDHLWIGAVRDNARDAATKGRLHRPSGETNPTAVLSSQQIGEIRERYRRGEATQADLAREFGTTFQNISSIVRGKSWASADVSACDLKNNHMKIRGERHRDAKLSAEGCKDDPIYLPRAFATGAGRSVWCEPVRD